MDTIAAIHGRRSVRRYAARPVSRALIEAIVWDAAQAPTTPVSEPWVFIAILGAARLEGYGARAKALAREHRPPGAGFDWADRTDFSVFHGAPAAVVIAAPGGNTQSAEDCTRAGQNLMLSAHARGLGTCWVGAPLLWLRDAAVRVELGIPPPCQPFAAFALGYPEGEPSGRPRERPALMWIGDDGEASAIR